MGYYSSMEGSFTVTPVPPASFFKPEKLNTDRSIQWGMECIKVDFEKETNTEVEPDGTEVTRTKVIRLTINSCEESEHKHYYVKEALQALVDQLGRERKYEGNFHLVGEDHEQWGFVICDGEVKEVKPTITWPDGMAC